MAVEQQGQQQVDTQEWQWGESLAQNNRSQLQEAQGQREGLQAAASSTTQGAPPPLSQHPPWAPLTWCTLQGEGRWGQQREEQQEEGVGSACPLRAASTTALTTMRA